VGTRADSRNRRTPLIVSQVALTSERNGLPVTPLKPVRGYLPIEDAIEQAAEANRHAATNDSPMSYLRRVMLNVVIAATNDVAPVAETVGQIDGFEAWVGGCGRRGADSRAHHWRTAQRLG
jgi:hypothetical protein